MSRKMLNPGANEAIHAARMRRLGKAIQALENALSEGRVVSNELLDVSGLLERGIDPRKVRSAYGDLPRLLEVARAIEAQQQGASTRDPRRPSRPLKV